MSAKHPNAWGEAVGGAGASSDAMTEERPMLLCQMLFTQATRPPAWLGNFDFPAVAAYLRDQKRLVELRGQVKHAMGRPRQRERSRHQLLASLVQHRNNLDFVYMFLQEATPQLFV